MRKEIGREREKRDTHEVISAAVEPAEVTVLEELGINLFGIQLQSANEIPC